MPTDRDEAVLEAARKIVTSPFGSVSVPVQELKALIAMARVGYKELDGYTGKLAFDDNHLKIFEKWSRKLVEMGAP